MSEVAHTGHDHGQSEGIRSCDDFSIADGTARLNDSCNPKAGGFFNAVWEGEKGV